MSAVQENRRDSSSNQESQSKIQEKEGTPTDDELEELGDEIGNKWMKLGRRLRVSDPNIEEINKAHDQLSEKGYHMLKHWKQEKGSAATYQALHEALLHRLVGRKDLAEKFCYINAPADPVPEGTMTGEVSGAAASTRDSGHSTGVRSDWKGKTVKRAPADPVPEGTVTGDVSGVAASTCDSGHSTGVRSAQKLESVERGVLSWKMHCVSATSRSYRKQDPQEQSKLVNNYMARKINEVIGKGKFDMSSFEGLEDLYLYLRGYLSLVDIIIQQGCIKITVRCRTLEILERLWDDYCSGRLNAEAEKCLITENVKEELGMETIKLATTILEEDYLDCKFSLIETAAPADPVPEGTMTGEVSGGAAASTRDSGYSTGVRSDWKGKTVKRALADPVPEGTVTGEVSGAAASTHDSGHSTGERSAWKRKSVEQEPFNLEKCQEQLQSIYNTMSKVQIIPWDESCAIHIDDIYTTLSWVRDDRKPSGVTQEELKDYTDIFKGDKHYRNPKRLLVYGRPGIGKTTFSKKTAFDWSQQRKEILKKFDVVLLIKLRDVRNMQDIRDVLRASKLLAGGEMVSVDGVYEYIFRNQEKVLLILDGYDEYFCTGEKSPVRDIWEGTKLTNIHVIITTRQEKANELTRPSHVQFEIKGFKSDKQVRAFASNFLGDEEKLDDFLTYLSKRDLKDLAEIPLLLLMLCTVWKENHFKELPKSRAHICQNFVLTLIHHAITKDAKAEEGEDLKVNVLELYKVELFALGKLAFDALLQNALSFPIGKLPDSILSDKFIKFGLFHVLNVATFLRREKHVYFIHKSVQEYLAAFFLKEELLKEASTSGLSEVDSFKKFVNTIEVLRFACELSADAACAVLSHLGIVGKKEGLTEYNFTETPCIEDLSDDQKQFLTLISHSFYSCSAEKRRDLYPMFLSHVGGVLFIDSDQLHSLANEHLLKSAVAPEFIFFPSDLRTEQSYQELICVLEDLSAVVVCCSGEKKASDFVKKYLLSSVKVFLKKEEGKIYLYIAEIHNVFGTFPIELLTELISSPESTWKKPVDDQSNKQDDSSALCLTENSTDDTQATHHCLSFVLEITSFVEEKQKMETLIDVLPFVTSPQSISINGRGSAIDPVLVDKLVSRIKFTNRLRTLALVDIDLTATHAAVIARSLYQAPNLRGLNLSDNPLGEGVSDITRHLSCAPDLYSLDLEDVKMTKKQMSDLTEAVRQTKIRKLFTSYHDSEGNLKRDN